MTDRYNALTVVFERDMRDEDAKALMQAIGLMRGVAGVALNIADPGSFIAQERARTELIEKMSSILYRPSLG
jgi:hypothetical protein